MSAWWMGTMAGAFHAVSGADHIAALLPSVVACARPVEGRLESGVYRAAKIGAQWGTGHSLGAGCAGALAVCLKKMFAAKVMSASVYLEPITGITLLVIGLSGLRSSGTNHDHHDLLLQQKTSAVVARRRGSPLDESRPSLTFLDDEESVHVHGHPHDGSGASIYMGVLHGFTGTGHLVGVVPSLAYDSMLSSFFYLGGFCIGTLCAMAIFTSVVGAISVRLRHHIPLESVSRAASTFAIVIGFWVIMSWAL